jgi:SAM-dependent methyltransferase
MHYHLTQEQRIELRVFHYNKELQSDKICSMSIDPSSAAADDKKYSQSFAQFGPTPQALKWKDYKAGAVRYRQIVADIEIEGRTILDVGCGMGDILPYLYAKSPTFSYLGIDITPELIQSAQRRYSGHEFRVGNPFEELIAEIFDVVMTSGTLNSSASQQWSEERKKMIRTLFDLANEVLVFNMAGGVRQKSESGGIGYADSLEVLDFCSSLTNKLLLRNHYHSKDFTVVLMK